MKRTHMATLVWVAVVVLLVAGPAFGTSVTPTGVSTPVNVTHDKFADNEESQGMSPDGQLLAGAWNDWDYNDGCGVLLLDERWRQLGSAHVRPRPDGVHQRPERPRHRHVRRRR